MVWRLSFKRAWVFGLLLVFGLALAFYLVTGGTDSSLNLQREQVFARSEASNLSSFFQAFGKSVVVLSQMDSMKVPNARTSTHLDEFVSQWNTSNILGGVVLIDRYGTVLFNSNVAGTHDTGAVLSSRDYFLWAKNESQGGEYFIGKPVISKLGASKGRMIVPVAAAVYQGNVFSGVVVASVELAPLAQKFISLMKISETTDVYLVDREGDLLYSDASSDKVGVNVFDSLKENPFPGYLAWSDGIKNAVDSKGEGEFEASILDSKSHRVEEHTVVYSPVEFGDHSPGWLVIMAFPSRDIGSLAVPVSARIILLAVVVLATLFLFRLVKVRRVDGKKR